MQFTLSKNILIYNDNKTIKKYLMHEIYIVGVIGPEAHIYVYIGPGAQSEDVR